MRSTLVIGLLALVTFDQSLAQPQRVVQRTIVPYASGVEGNGFVSGSFVIRPARAGEKSVGTLFPVSGGACHVADLNAIGIPAPSAAVCQQDSDCNNRLSRQHYAVAGWRSYCSSGTCLTRPGGQTAMCSVGGPRMDGRRYTIPLVNARSVRSPINTSRGGQSDRLDLSRHYWTVHACLNGARGRVGAPDRPCSNEQSDPNELKVDAFVRPPRPF